MRRRQRQSAGADSTNFQAGQDIIVHTGVTATEAQNIALNVFQANFLRLSGVAQEIARDRAERITREYLDQLQQCNPSGLNSVQDPDMLQAIYTAQKGYACSGEEDLEVALIDLLVDRSGQKDRDLKTLVLNEAIATLPKLTRSQRKAIAVCFLVYYTRYPGPFSLPAFYSYIANDIAPFTSIADIKRADYQYIDAAGAGSFQEGNTATLETAFSASFHGFFVPGFSRDDVPDILRNRLDDSSIFMPCLRNPEKLQLNAITQKDVIKLTGELIREASGINAVLDNLLDNPLANPRSNPLEYSNQMEDGDIRQDVVSHIPAMAELFDHWNTSGLGGLRLTMSGIAIGHAYWRRITGGHNSLDTWLS